MHESSIPTNSPASELNKSPLNYDDSQFFRLVNDNKAALIPVNSDKQDYFDWATTKEIWDSPLAHFTTLSAWVNKLTTSPTNDNHSYDLTSANT